MTELVRDRSTSTAYEVSTLVGSFIVSALAAPFNFVTTGHTNAHGYARASSMASNAIVNFYVTKVSLDYLADLIRNEKYAQVLGILFLSAISNAPSAFIVTSESTDSKALTIFVAISTCLSGVFLSAYAIGSLPRFFRSLKIVMMQESPSETKSNVMTNVAELLRRVRVSDYLSQSLSCQTENELLIVSTELAKTAKNPYFNEIPCWLLVFKPVLQVAVSLLLLYGNIGYACASEESIRKDFHVSPVVAAVLANVSMIFSYILSLKGGFGLVGGIVEDVSILNYRTLLPNEYKLGGLLGAVFAVASPILAAVIASCSGVVSKSFCDSCASSILAPLTFPDFETVVSYSTRVFNSVYVAMAFSWLINYCIARKGTEQDKAYLFFLKSLTDLLDRVSCMSNEEISAYAGEPGASDAITVDVDVNWTTMAHSEITVRMLSLSPPVFANRFFQVPENRLCSETQDENRAEPLLLGE